MSDIDLISHSKAGDFLGIPVYFALGEGAIGTRRKQNDGIFVPKHLTSYENVRPGSLVIGGGDGEHPAIVFHDVCHAVARFIAICLRLEKDEDLARHGGFSANSSKSIEYCNWKNASHIEFFKTCKPEFLKANMKDWSLEGWLLLSIGCFAFENLHAQDNTIELWRKRFDESLKEIPDTVGRFKVIKHVEQQTKEKRQSPVPDQ